MERLKIGKGVLYVAGRHSSALRPDSCGHPERRWKGIGGGLAASARGLHEGQTLTGCGHLGTGRRGEIHYAVTLSCN